MSDNISAINARRLFLHAQALLDGPAASCSAVSVGKLIEQLGFVQIDTINVVERAHHLILASRFDSYDRGALDKLCGEKHRKIFEHWTHDASYIPTKWFAHWRPRFERYRLSSWHSRQIG